MVVKEVNITYIMFTKPLTLDQQVFVSILLAWTFSHCGLCNLGEVGFARIKLGKRAFRRWTLFNMIVYCFRPTSALQMKRHVRG
jgi:hypothetical protein